MGGVTGTTKEREREAQLEQVRRQVMSFADLYVGTLLDAGARVPQPTPEAEVRVLAFQVRQATDAWEIASAGRPVADAIDMVLLVSFTRWVLSRPDVADMLGPAGPPLRSSLPALEEQAWTIARSVIDAEQEKKLRAFIQDWLEKNKDFREVGSARLAGLGDLTGGRPFGLGTPGDLLKSMGLDPLGGIDPAVAEVQQSRILAERAFYFAKRWPQLLEMHTRLLTLQLASQPVPRRALDDVHRVSLAAESVARTAEGLPGLVDREREAAIRQFMEALSAQEARARALAAEIRRTLDAGSGAANATRQAVEALEAFVALVNKPSPPGSTPGRPFDVTEYGRALAELSEAATRLEALFRQVDKDAPRAAALLGDAGRELSARGTALVDHAFRRLLQLGLALVGAALLAALAYRWAARRMARP